MKDYLFSIVKMMRYTMTSIAVFTILQSGNSVLGQSKEEIFVTAEVMPSFPGGTAALMNAIYKNLTYPQDARDNGIEGKVILRLVINKEGYATQPVIVKGLYPSIDMAVLNIVPNIPRFEPGKNAGSPVNVWYSVPVVFKLLK